MDKFSKALRILFISLIIIGLFFLAVLGYAIYQRSKTRGVNTEQQKPLSNPIPFNPSQLTPEQKADILQKLAPPANQPTISNAKKIELLQQLQSTEKNNAPVNTGSKAQSPVADKQASETQDYQMKKKILEQISPK